MLPTLGDARKLRAPHTHALDPAATRAPNLLEHCVKPQSTKCAALAGKRTFAAYTMGDGNAQILAISRPRPRWLAAARRRGRSPPDRPLGGAKPMPIIINPPGNRP